MLALRSFQRLREHSLSTKVLETGRRALSAEIQHPNSSTCGDPPLDKIHMQGMRFFGYHGVLPEERRMGQKFIVSAMLAVDLRKAGATDDLQHTVNYAEVFSDVAAIVEGPPRHLIESLATAIADTILQRHPLVQAASIRVDKPQAPVVGMFDTIAVELTRSRS